VRGILLKQHNLGNVPCTGELVRSAKNTYFLKFSYSRTACSVSSRRPQQYHWGSYLALFLVYPPHPWNKRENHRFI